MEVENLVKVFYDKKNKREVRAVDDLSFKISAGEIFGFLGPNGAGKTTTMRILAGLYTPTAGQARVLGLDVTKVGDRIRQHIGFLTENHGNYENLTVIENLRFFSGFYPIQGVDSRIDEVLDELGLTDRKNFRVGKLSKGLKQRLALARVLLPNPRILFLDEPTSGLDPQAAVDVRNIITGLRSGERTIFLNSHNLEEVQKICDRVGIINAGKLVQVGTTAQLNKDLFGAQELTIRLKEPISEYLVSQLEQLQFMKSVQVNHTQVHLRLRDLDVNAPEVIACLSKGGARILEVKQGNHSLEEIYLALMSDSRNNAVRWA